jgi:hypothetical protein
MLERWPVASYSGPVQVRSARYQSQLGHLKRRLSGYFKFNISSLLYFERRRREKERMHRVCPSPSPKAKVDQPEVTMYQPKIRLRPEWWHWLAYIPQFILWIVLIVGNAFLSWSIFNHRLLPRDEITESPQFIVLFACMMIPFVIRFYQGYTDDTIRPLDGHGREEWARTLNAIFRRPGEVYRNPSETDDTVELRKKTFAEYVADPYSPFSLPPFSRRLIFYFVIQETFLGFLCTRLPFRVDSKYHGEPNRAQDVLCQFLGCVSFGFWCWLLWGRAWLFGLLYRMGGIAKQIRRKCGKSDRADADMEKGIEVGDETMQLELWIQAILKKCDGVECKLSSANGKEEEDK